MNNSKIPNNQNLLLYNDILMINNTFNIVSYLSNEKGSEKISLIYDTINKRVIEKWISYQLDNDESKFIITDRFIYVYNKFNIVSSILEVEKGYENRYPSYNDNNEYCHSINRTVNKISLHHKNTTEINYTRNNHIGSKRKKIFIKTLNLVTKEVEDNIFKSRINYILKKSKLYIYEYRKNDFCSLYNIVEYKILVDFRFINRYINKIGVPILMTIPDLFLKIKIKDNLQILDNKETSIKLDEQDYFNPKLLNVGNNKFFIQNLILIEDLFVNEINNIHEKYYSLK